MKQINLIKFFQKSTNATLHFQMIADGESITEIIQAISRNMSIPVEDIDAKVAQSLTINVQATNQAYLYGWNK